MRKQVLAGARAALALLLSGAMTVIGLPSCAGGGGGRESWQPTSFVGPDDEVVFLHAPMLGTPAIQTDRRGLVHNRQLSTPYGVRTAHEGADPDSFRFTDKEWDELTGLIYFGARYDDAELGTWISVDPLALWGDDGSLSPFDLNATAYVGGRVTIAVDEFGFQQEIRLPNGMRIGNSWYGGMENLARGFLQIGRAADEATQPAQDVWNDGGREVVVGTVLLTVTIASGGTAAPATAAAQIVFTLSVSASVSGGITMATIGMIEMTSDEVAESRLNLEDSYAVANCASNMSCLGTWAAESSVTGEELPSETAELVGAATDFIFAGFAPTQRDAEFFQNAVDVSVFVYEAFELREEITD